MKRVKQPIRPGYAYKIISKSPSFIERYGENSKIWIESTAQAKFGKNYIRKKELIIKFYRGRLNEIPNPKTKVYFGSVEGTIDSSNCLVKESEIDCLARE
jgi:hypothetical protein